MKVLKAESEGECLKIFIEKKLLDNGQYHGFSYRYTVSKNGYVSTTVSEKEYFKSERFGFRSTIQSVLTLLSMSRSKLNLSEIERYYTKLLSAEPLAS